MIEDRLKQALEEFCGKELGEQDGDYVVGVGRNWLGRLIALVRCKKFDDMIITERQEKVWKYLRDGNRLPPEDRQAISLIFTKGWQEEIVEEELETQKQRGLPWMR